MRRITVQSQPGQIVCKTLSGKALHKNRAGGGCKVKAFTSSPSTAKKNTKAGKLGVEGHIPA
jgi:hypothetical protein